MAKTAILDANLLAYSLDEANPEKQERALAVMDVLMDFKRGVVTTQTLAEFFIAITRRIAVPVPLPDAYEKVEEVIRSFEVLQVTASVVLDAVRAARDYQFHYWDAQVWATAKLYQIPFILTEDLPGRDFLEGVRFLNPFLPDFDMTILTG